MNRMSTVSLPSDRSIMVAGHICLDMTPQFPPHADGSLTPGTLVRVSSMHYSVGGTVGNTGLALHQLGVNTRLLAQVGVDLHGNTILDILRALSPDLANDMMKVQGETTSYSVVIAPPNVDRLFLHCPGCNDNFKTDNITLTSNMGIKLLHFGYPPVMKTVYENRGKTLVDLFIKAHDAGIVTSLDMCSVDPNSDAGQVDWRDWLEQVLPYVDIFVPSLDEVLFILGLPTQEQPTIAVLQQVADQLIAWGARIVMLKLGAYGVYLQTTTDSEKLAAMQSILSDTDAWAGQSMYASCYAVDVVSTNGAGDYTIAGFLTGLLAGQNPTDAMQSAVGVGASHVQSPTTLPDWHSIQQHIQSGWPHLAITIDTQALQPITEGVWSIA